MKTFAELESIGIVGNYVDNRTLHIITKDGGVWSYDAKVRKFKLIHVL